MVKVIPARLENGHVVPEAPLPAAAEIRSVAILLEMETLPSTEGARRMEKWYGVLKGYEGDPKEDYRKHLEEKYL
jgi:hypothetical protein